jgi:hypothetical protein
MAKKKKASGPSWDKIGAMIGKKVEKEFEGSECGPWGKWASYHEEHGGGFFGRALFIIGLLVALNMLGVLEGVNIWIQVLIGVGFALMRLD